MCWCCFNRVGDDGLRGMITFKEKVGVTIAQDKESCYAYGMFRAVIDSGCPNVKSYPSRKCPPGSVIK